MTAPAAEVLAFPPADGRKAFTVDQVRAEILQLINIEGLKQSKIARASGVPVSTLSAFLSGSYKGDNQKVADTLGIYLASRARTAGASSIPLLPDYIATPTSEKIVDALNYAQMFADIAAIYGGRGLGKTRAARRYRDTNPNVWIITATPETSSVGTILEEIALGLGMRDMPLHPARLRRQIDLFVEGTKGLLIIDEAQHLTKQALESIRGIHDRTGVGLALMGNTNVYNRLYGSGMKSEDFAQLYSRIGKRVFLKQPVAGDIHAIAGAFGITDARALGWLKQIAMKPGGLRGVAKTMRLAATFAHGAGQPLALVHLDAAWGELQGAADAMEVT